MEPTFKWIIQDIYCKPTFTDKYNNLRSNAIKTVNLLYIGSLGNIEHRSPLSVNLSLIDLTNFIDRSEISNEQVLEMALSSRNPKEIEAIENSVKNRFK
jgi:hypothetical protein